MNNGKSDSLDTKTQFMDVYGIIGYRFIKNACVRQAKRMAANFKKQYSYEGALKKKILDGLGNVKEFSFEQRKEAFNF